MGLSGDCTHEVHSLPAARGFIWDAWRHGSPATAVVTVAHWNGSQLLPAELKVIVSAEKGDRQVLWTLQQNGQIIEEHVFHNVTKARGGRGICAMYAFRWKYVLLFHAETRSDDRTL
jgi:hypothetical protein